MAVATINAHMLKDSVDFSVVIGWSGEESKPYYRAVLLSASRATTIVTKPFWGYEVISAAEFDRLLDVIEASGRRLVIGAYSGQANEYYLQIEAAHDVYHSLLGFDQDTIGILNRMADTLAPVHQWPIRDIVARISSALQPGPP